MKNEKKANLMTTKTWKYENEIKSWQTGEKTEKRGPRSGLVNGSENTKKRIKKFNLYKNTKT